MTKQKIKTNEKTKKWFRECVKEGIKETLNSEYKIKPKDSEYKVWDDLYHGRSDSKDVKGFFDTLGIQKAKFNPSFKQLSSVYDRVELLHGEYLKRFTDYEVAVLDEYGINLKLKEKKKKAKEFFMEYLDGMEDDEMNKRIKEFDAAKYRSEEEKAAYKLLELLKRNNNFETIQHEGFREAIKDATSLFKIDIIRNNVVVRKCDPTSTYLHRTGNSYKASDAEMIAEVRYLSPVKIVELYSEHLKDKQVEAIYEGNASMLTQNGDSPEYVLSKQVRAEKAKQDLVFEHSDDADLFLSSDGGNHDIKDDEGNIRIIQFSWKGFRLVHKRKRYVNGKPFFDYVGEYYEANEDEGETLEKLWIPEWHSGVLIGDDLVVDAKVNEIQYRSKYDPTICKSGYAGGYFNVGNNRALSLVGRAAPIMYMQDLIFAKVEDLIAKNIGKVIEIDISRKPKDWTVKKWLYYLKHHNIYVVNYLNESDKGYSMGKMAGMYNQGNKAVDMETGGSISYYIDLYMLLDRMLAKTTGITDQRLGGVDYKEPVTTVEGSKVQSSHITEFWFQRYEEFMLEVNSLILNAGNILIDENKVIQGVLSDATFSILKAKGKDSSYIDLGIFPISSRDRAEFKDIIEQAAINAIPNGTMTIDQLANVLLSKGSRDMQDKLNKYLEENRDEQRKAAEQQQQAEMQSNQAERDFEMEKMQIEQKHEMEMEVFKQEMELQKLKIKMDYERENKKEESKKGLSPDLERRIKEKELEIKERKMKLDEAKAISD